MTDATFWRSLNLTASVTTTTPTETSPGRWTQGSPQSSPLRCRIRGATSEEQVLARQEGRRVTHVLECGPTESVGRGAVVTWTDARGSHEAHVEAVKLTSSGHHLEVQMDERQTAEAA